MLFSTHLTLALPMASVVFGELTESLSRSRVARGIIQHQELPRKALVLSNMQPLILDTIVVVSSTVATGTNHTVSFGITDPNSNTSTSCVDSWTETTSGSDYPSSYIQCPSSNISFEHWQWYFEVFNSFSSFTFRIDHTYTDNDVGQAPYNKLSTFSRASANLTCETNSTSGLETPCGLATASNTVPAPVWGLSA